MSNVIPKGALESNPYPASSSIDGFDSNMGFGPISLNRRSSAATLSFVYGLASTKSTSIASPKPALKRDNRYQRDKKRKMCRRRAAIEPLIGHFKSDFRLSRNFLSGTIGDVVNLHMAACAWNLRKWMRKALERLFCALKNGFMAIFCRIKRNPLSGWAFCWGALGQGLH